MKHGRRCAWPGVSPGVSPGASPGAGVEARMPQHRLMKLRQSMETQGAREWIAEAQGWEIESTFTLQPGWDPALEGQPAQTYSPVTNPDFANVAQVYRLWVLNEDGAFGFASGQALPRFDLAAFFEDATVQPQRLHLGDCLVTEQGRVRRKPVVEHSIDGGQTWQAWAGRVTVLADRAGIQFEDSELPVDVYTAAQAGLWRVRITASLRSPVPMMVRRWQGNPLGTTQSARQLQAEDAFSFRRIDAGSIHHQAVRAGELEAMEVDDSQKLWQWLLGRMARDQTESLHGQADLELSGAQTHWRPGDQLMQVQDGQTWRVTVVECHWPASALAANNSSSSGPITRLRCQAMKGG
ncbi:MAG: hypothetical protein HC898_10900 [Phycisphaerales bacterium]|nr:hypothetical protein [Phycisphaerales bacterium]